MPPRPARALALLLLACWPAGARAADPPAGGKRPNLVVILADDLGWGDVGYLGGSIETPRIDALAAGGVRLEQFYMLQECTPSRAALLTGRHAIRYGLQEGVLWPWSPVGLSLDEQLLPQALRAAGYATVMVGKWHLGHDPKHQPMARGFDHHYGPYLGFIDHFLHQYYRGLDWHRDGQPLREEGWDTALLGREAARVVEQHDFAARPLFLYFAPLAPHAPLQAPAEAIAHYAGEIPDENQRTYAAMVTGLDDAVGMLLDALEKREVMGNTLVVFASDNGGALEYGGSNGKLRGQKGELWEGGVRVPAIASWRGVLPPGGQVKTPLHVTDLYPTLLRLAGATPEQQLPLDGVDAWPAIARGEALPRSEILLNLQARQSALRSGDWKIVRSNLPGGFKVELFDLSKDPYEKNELSRRFPEKMDELEARLVAWQRQAVRALGPFPMNKPAGFPVPDVWGN